MQFKTWLSVVHDPDPHNKFSECGKHEVDKLHLVINKKGYPTLESCGKTDLYAQIQSYKESCDLASILRSFDIGSLPTLQFGDLGDISDFCDAPQSAGELLRLINDGELMFSQLPASVRAEFNNSLYNFVGAFGSVDFVSRLEKAYGVQKDISGSIAGDVSSVDPVVGTGDTGSGQSDSGVVSPDTVPVAGNPINVKEVVE